MKVPPILLAVILVGGGILAPSAVVAARRAPAGAVGMTHEGFAVQTVKITVGQRLTFFNDSHFVHVVGPGDDGRLGSEAGTPQMTDRGAFLSQTNDTYTTGPWLVSGTYHLTCSLHPEMNLTVIVTS